MSDLYDQANDEHIVDAEMDDWMAEVAENAENIMLRQKRLAESPEFQALMLAYRAAPKEKAKEYLKSVADYVVLFA